MRAEILFDSKIIPGYARFRIPGVVVCADGKLLAYCEARKTDDDWAQIDILLRRSTDGGRSFSAPVVLVCGTEMKKTVNNPVMIAGRDGTVHFLYCVEYGLVGEGGVFYRRSADAGSTWSAPRDITDMTSPEIRNVFAPGPGHGIELINGTLFVPCWTVLKQHGREPRSHHPGSVCCLVSKDKGLTWEIGSFVPNGEVNDPNETAAAQLPDGTVALNIRDGDTHHRCCSFGSYKTASPLPDDSISALRTPLSFSPIRKLPDLPDPVCCTGMAAAGNTLYLTHCRDTNKRRNLTLEQSADGMNWQKIQVIDPGDAGYSDIAFCNDTLYVAYEKGTAVVMTTVPVL